MDNPRWEILGLHVVFILSSWLSWGPLVLGRSGPTCGWTCGLRFSIRDFCTNHMWLRFSQSDPSKSKSKIHDLSLSNIFLVFKYSWGIKNYIYIIREFHVSSVNRNSMLIQNGLIRMIKEHLNRLFMIIKVMHF